MRITFSDAGKRFNRDWIFRHFSFNFLPDTSYAITGSNGSGKSTLLQVIGGSMAINAGKVQWFLKDELQNDEIIYRNTAIAAPYLELVEEMTSTEFLHFHSKFKPLINTLSIAEMLGLIGLEKAANKQIRNFSSGMKQRLKLGQAIFSNVPLLLLDEPCTNLDVEGIALYQHLICTYCQQKTIIVSSNDPVEYSFCQQVVSVMDYKGK